MGFDFNEDNMLYFLDFDPYEVNVFNGIRLDGDYQNDFFVIQGIENFEYIC
jgi:hypothetical protein